MCLQLNMSFASASPLDVSSRRLEFVSPGHCSTAATSIHRLISKISPKLVNCKNPFVP